MNADEKTRITVEIYGSEYKLLATTTPAYVRWVASQVDDHMKRIAKAYPRLDGQRIAVLAAVNLADEQAKLLQELEDLQQLKQQYEQSGVLLEQAKREAEAARSEAAGARAEAQAAQEQAHAGGRRARG
ncbi:cell division protein ZapA, partial [Gordoniibacillus kamchatkensis]|uniref:cell division protein ZapA n=1 Tax=Gordoniibacillus kamchatkensis TaxID=1590651 RepID=UPI0018CFA56B